jgi:hypothetical protein
VYDRRTLANASLLLKDLDLYVHELAHDERVVGVRKLEGHLRRDALPARRVDPIFAVQVPKTQLAIDVFENGVKVGHEAVHDLAIIERVSPDSNGHLKKNPLTLTRAVLGPKSNAEPDGHAPQLSAVVAVAPNEGVPRPRWLRGPLSSLPCGYQRGSAIG